MKISDLGFGILFVVLGGAILVYALSIPPMAGQRYGAGLFPAVLGFCLIAGGACLGMQGYRNGGFRTAIVSLAPWMRIPELRNNVLFVLGSILGYVLLERHVGFVPLAFAILVILFLRGGNPLLKSLLIAGGTVAFIHVAFVMMLRVPLPRGVIDTILYW